MLRFLEDEVEAIKGSERKVLCMGCMARYASWRTRPEGEDTLEPYCGWCLLYGQTQWGRDNKDEIVHMGNFVRRLGEQNQGKNTYVPELDPRHRMEPKAAERFVAGIFSTSYTMQMALSRLSRFGAFMEGFDAADPDDRGSAETQGHVPAPARWADGEAS